MTKKAFTLIELLVTIAIILLMAVLSVPAFNQYAANNEVSAKAEEIQAILQKAYALSQSPPAGASSIYFYISDNSTKISIHTKDAPDDIVSEVDSVTIPSSYMSFSDTQYALGDTIKCEFKSPGISDCKNINTNPPTALESMTRELASDKTSVRYQIIMDFKNFRVSSSKL